MSSLVPAIRALMELALAHPDGPATARSFDHAFQFEIEDEGNFFLQVQGGRIIVEEGDSGLDWKVRDWQRVTCLHTSAAVLREAIAGQRLLAEAFFAGELGFAASRAAGRHTDATVEGSLAPWLYALFRLAHEQAGRVGYEQIISEIEHGSRA